VDAHEAIAVEKYFEEELDACSVVELEQSLSIQVGARSEKNDAETQVVAYDAETQVVA
jgi:hypothetical protein